MYKLNIVFASVLLFAGCVMTEAGSEDPVPGEAVQSSESLDGFAPTSDLATGVTEEGISDSSLAWTDDAEGVASSALDAEASSLLAPVDFGYRCCYCERDCNRWDHCTKKCYCAFDEDSRARAKGKAEDRCRIRLDHNDHGCWFDGCDQETRSAPRD